MNGQQPVPPQFGKRLRRERERHGWSLRDIGDKCGIGPSTVMRIENGADAALSSVVAITSTLGLSIDALVAESSCGTCDGMPPAGFVCSQCGRPDRSAAKETP